METRKDRIRNKSIELILASTSHGIPNIFRTKRKSIKTMWILLFLIFSSLGTYMVYSTIFNYLKYEVVTNIDLIHEMPSEFPAVTIINLRNPKSNVSLNSIMLACQFSNELCNANDFEKNVDKLGYVSYKFKKKLSHMPGSLYGLRVLINLKDDSKKTGFFKGLRLIVHNETLDSGYHGGYSHDGNNIATGFLTDLIVSRVFSQKLGEPYNSCLKNLTSADSYDSDIYRYIFNSTRFKYRQRDCFNYCVGKKFNDILNNNNSGSATSIQNYADIWYSFQSDLMRPKLNDFYFNVVKGNIKKYCANDCPLECDSVKYEVSSSFTKISNETFYNFLEQFRNSNLNKVINSDNLENLVYFNVYYNELEYTFIKQLPKMDIFQFISNIGGNLSLFIGISFLSFAELIELAIETCYIYSEKKNFKNLQNR